jgi:hypothetical protein
MVEHSSAAECCAACAAKAGCTLFTLNNSTGLSKCFLKLEDHRASCPSTGKGRREDCISGAPAVASFCAAVLTGICLGHVCSCPKKKY